MVLYHSPDRCCLPRSHSRHTAQRSLLALSSNISPLSLLPCVFTLQLVRLRQISSHAGRSRWRRRDSGANSPLSTVERRGITLQLHLQVVSEEVRSSIMLGAFLALPSNSTLQSLGPGYSIISRGSTINIGRFGHSSRLSFLEGFSWGEQQQETMLVGGASLSPTAQKNFVNAVGSNPTAPSEAAPGRRRW